MQENCEEDINFSNNKNLISTGTNTNK